ncbi:Protein of unknown function (DUF2870) [Leishmania donovani]|uniref:Protein_of_uncharacterized_function_(DUF2870)_-_p utative n=3 Tax=Leishmania donovani species complex TaxID=38574 RepID=A0A6L0XSG2_LEIIN|nr:conserved hypothetical protein [Leishmania infantum JPCM5]XP_003865480.1 hypothetical protein, conserved [Leishmania donovani]CAC9551255.1 Protein_of_uncharacterised_function_(DUF2870)_-_putative [Leishmania infantum]AYU83720.1 Protein of unknown function (DUF2870), putative [Leishmania donovani]TPP42090.1 hypothetical protein CGC20_28160 [Leishmania donovani]TPP48472.1 hypothetical protein CGC21_14110 [Leishmania donovani]CAJ1993738.1 Protein of unknown function (DUF2870) [Leishmania dono|eukprot:XP_001469667.1 conserved hypothetical protein [Leishmania infantum JPCM5]
MVLVVVKGTNYPDEFTVERALTDALSSSEETPRGAADVNSPPHACSSLPSTSTIVPGIAHILNKRHHVRLMLMSAQELATLWPQHQHRSDGTASTEARETQEPEEVLGRYQALIDGLYARLRDAKTPVLADEFDKAEHELRALTATLYSSLCTHADGPEAAVQQLYTKHEDPDLDEDTRLVVYHCRALLDPEWKANERVKEDDAALWFCGKPMNATLAKYCGRNEKSKVIVKVAPRKGPAPSCEPRMRYEDQRALYRALCQRREAYKQLEDSELRDRVVQQSRSTRRLLLGAAAAFGSRTEGAPTVTPLASGTSSPAMLRTDGLRPIFPRKEERELPIS